jgi:hypothetical protein
MSEGNKDIAKHGEATRFGAERGPDPAEAVNKRNEEFGHPNSIRGSIRRIACLRRSELADMVKDENLSMAQVVAVSKYQKAMKGDVKAMKELEDSVDGKLVETKIEVKTDSYADLLQQAEEARRNGIRPQ